MINLVIADDHAIILNGVKLIADQSDFIRVTGFVQKLDDLESCLTNLSPDILLLDILFQGNNSLDMLPAVVEKFPKTKVLIFSSFDAPFLISYCMRNGASGYLFKDATLEELEKAIKVVEGGGLYNPGSVEGARTSSDKDSKEFQLFKSINALSDREREIVRLKVSGYTVAEIADQLFISYYTAKTHLKNILRKLDLHSSVELAAYLHKMEPFLLDFNR